LLDAANVAKEMSILDVGCGPGYVSAAAAERGAKPIGLDFSAEMIAIAKKMFPRIEFRRGDAQNLPFANASFDRVVANFALLHLADPERACVEAARVLKPGGRFGFTTWAKISENPFVKLVDDAIQAHANLEVDLPPGPPFYLFENEEEFRNALERTGFDGTSMTFKVHKIEWQVPTARFIFDAERNAGVRTAGLLARQTPEALRKIQSAIEKSVQSYAPEDVRHVFLSHIHFDHAGAAWRFAGTATVYVHPRGAPHLIDPTKLVESATRIFGDDMERLWGKIAPVPAARVKILEDNEVVRVPPFEIRAIATPGHASHHHVYHWDDNIFGGDIAGVRIGNGPPIPPFVPPELHVD